MQADLNWFDQKVKFRRARGAEFEGTPLDLTAAYAHDPVIAVAAGHPFVERGFEFLLRDILQIACPPADDEEWAERLFEPPTPEELRAAVGPYRAAFVLDHPAYPALQVRPTCEWEPDPRPIAALLPDAPTKEAVKSDEDFFAKRGAIGAIGAGLILPTLYAHTVMFPSEGGGYWGMPHGAGSVRYQLIGPTLWERVFLNVLSKDNPHLASGPWPVPADATAFSWLRDDIRTLELGQITDSEREKRKKRGENVPDTYVWLRPHDFHPAGVVTCRRYLLMPAENGRCNLSGVGGPIFTHYQRWQHGPRPTGTNWLNVSLAKNETYERQGDGTWPAQPTSAEFRPTSGPLRFDDWLEIALGGVPSQAPADAKKWTRIVPPPVIRSFANRRTALKARTKKAGASTAGYNVVGERLRCSVRAFNRYPHPSNRKVMGGTSERELPVYNVSEHLAADVAHRAAGAAEQVAGIADKLENAAAQALRLGRDLKKVKPTTPKQLRDAFMARMDRAVVALPGRVIEEAYGAYEDEDDQDRAANALAADLLRRARSLALSTFDEAFPVAELDDAGVKILRARKGLRVGISNT